MPTARLLQWPPPDVTSGWGWGSLSEQVWAGLQYWFLGGLIS